MKQLPEELSYKGYLDTLHIMQGGGADVIQSNAASSTGLGIGAGLAGPTTSLVGGIVRGIGARRAGAETVFDGAKETGNTSGTLALPSPEFKVPTGYSLSRNADGSATVTGPRGGVYNSTGRYTAEGKPIYRDNSGGYVTLDGGRNTVSAPPNYESVPLHHICTNKLRRVPVGRWLGRRSISVSLMGLVSISIAQLRIWWRCPGIEGRIPRLITDMSMVAWIRPREV